MSPYILNIPKNRIKFIQKAVSLLILVAFVSTSVQTPVYAQAAASPLAWMPTPGTMVNLSSEFTPAHLKGMVIHPDNALQFDFIMHRGDENLSGDQKKEEYNKLIKYFLASLAVPDENQWVNLSPYEKDRIVKDDFGKTEMGRDLLAQDYILKQITASLIYPESNLGQKFWDKVFIQAQQQYGTSQVPVNTFNKVWIVPDEAYIYEKDNTVYIVKQHLKVMLEEDYLSLAKHAGITSKTADQGEEVNKIGSQVVREIVLPALEKEVNEGKNFAMLRQVYSGMLLAAWYKRALKESLLGKIYADRSKVKGIDQDPKVNQEIYQQYLKAFKKGVFNYIKEDVDRYSKEAIPRKYFSGGANGFKYRNADGAMVNVFEKIVKSASPAMVAADAAQIGDFETVRADLAQTSSTPVPGSPASLSAEDNASIREADEFKRRLYEIGDNLLFNEERKAKERAMLLNAVVQKFTALPGFISFNEAKEIRDKLEATHNEVFLMIVKATSAITFKRPDAAMTADHILGVSSQKPSEQVVGPLSSILSIAPFKSLSKPTVAFAKAASLDPNAASFQDGPKNSDILQWPQTTSFKLKGRAASSITAQDIYERLLAIDAGAFPDRKRGIFAFSISPLPGKEKGFYTFNLFIQPHSSIPHAQNGVNSLIHIYFSLSSEEKDRIVDIIKGSPEALIEAMKKSTNSNLRNIYEYMIKPSLSEDIPEENRGFYGLINVGDAQKEGALIIPGLSNVDVIMAIKKDPGEALARAEAKQDELRRQAAQTQAQEREIEREKGNLERVNYLLQQAQTLANGGKGVVSFRWTSVLQNLQRNLAASVITPEEALQILELKDMGKFLTILTEEGIQPVTGMTWERIRGNGMARTWGDVYSYVAKVMLVEGSEKIKPENAWNILNEKWGRVVSAAKESVQNAYALETVIQDRAMTIPDNPLYKPKAPYLVSVHADTGFVVNQDGGLSAQKFWIPVNPGGFDQQELRALLNSGQLTIETVVGPQESLANPNYFFKMSDQQMARSFQEKLSKTRVYNVLQRNSGNSTFLSRNPSATRLITRYEGTKKLSVPLDDLKRLQDVIKIAFNEGNLGFISTGNDLLLIQLSDGELPEIIGKLPNSSDAAMTSPGSAALATVMAFMGFQSTLLAQQRVKPISPEQVRAVEVVQTPFIMNKVVKPAKPDQPGSVEYRLSLTNIKSIPKTPENRALLGVLVSKIPKEQEKLKTDIQGILDTKEWKELPDISTPETRALRNTDFDVEVIFNEGGKAIVRAQLTLQGTPRVRIKSADGGDKAQSSALGGIDLNSANLILQIKRDGRGVPLPIGQQDINLLNSIEGLVPVILEIKPAITLPLFSELQDKFKSNPIATT